MDSDDGKMIDFYYCQRWHRTEQLGVSLQPSEFAKPIMLRNVRRRRKKSFPNSVEIIIILK